jgi:hypothetical protein
MINDITKTSRDKLTASEAIFGFCGWLTTRSEITRMGSSENCTGIPDLIAQFIWENDLNLPRDGWENNLIHPSGEWSFGNNTPDIDHSTYTRHEVIDIIKALQKAHTDDILELQTSPVIDWEFIARGLYQILDDIDTASDHYKPEKSMYTHYVMEKVREKSNYMWSDGYDIFPRDSFPIRQIVTNDPMVDYFTDCWEIESSYDEPIPEIPMNGKIEEDTSVEPSVIDLHQTMDAQVWATEFCSIFEDIYGHKIDDEWMYSWFANSIMCGYDHQSWKRDKEYIYILKTRGGDILKVFHWEPSEKDIREEYVKHYSEDLVGKDYNIWDYTRLFRWSRSYGLTEINGPKSDTQYDWKAVNQ